MSGCGSDAFYLAPLRGVTGRTFRAVQARHFTPAPVAVAPFIPTCAGDRVKPAVLADIAPDPETPVEVIPQLIGKDPGQLRVMLRALKDMGYRKADLNAGCPWPFVAKKGRGCGLMASAEAFERMLEAGCDELPDGFSVKVRLGLKDSGLLAERMPVINRYPLREVTIHPRTAKQMYDGQVDLDVFAEVLPLCRHPVVYNGDIRTCADWQTLKRRFPQVTRWMVGRGMAMNPALMESFLAGTDLPPDYGRIAGFCADYLETAAAELAGPTQVLGRMKELWSYLHFIYPDSETRWKAIRLCRTLDEYLRVVRG